MNGQIIGRLHVTTFWLYTQSDVTGKYGFLSFLNLSVEGKQ